MDWMPAFPHSTMNFNQPPIRVSENNDPRVLRQILGIREATDKSGERFKTHPVKTDEIRRALGLMLSPTDQTEAHPQAL
jgi:hypothetical protein